MSAYIDHVLALFPFEPPLMQAAGMDCDFVGHPVVAEAIATDEEAANFRAALTAETKAPIILALPGSRKGEVARLSERFGQALEHVVAAHPNAEIVVPCAAPVFELVKQQTKKWPGKVTLIEPGDDRKKAAFAAADVALAASGTVSLELAAAGTPMVIAYDMAWLSRIIISWMLKVDTVTLVNLVSETRAVPEFIGKNCVSEKIGAALLDVLRAPTDQTKAMSLTMERLGLGDLDPGIRAATVVLEGLK